jgi:tetratricopeptide (TPR) repeat protein
MLHTSEEESELFAHTVIFRFPRQTDSTHEEENEVCQRQQPHHREKLELHFANYFYAVAKFPDAARHAEAALATNPKSISADIVLGEVKRAQGDLAGALEVFQKATLEFYQQNPNSYEPPTLLLSRISDLQEKLESAGPKAASPR